MGLAASQGRLLSLTSRNHDLVYEAQQISQQRLVLAEATKEASEKYTKAMNNTVMQGTVNGESQPLTYDLITSQDPFSGLCMRLVDKNGSVVVPDENIEVQRTVKDEQTGAEKTVSMGRFNSSIDFINAFMSNLPQDKKTELSSYSLADISRYYNETYESKNPEIKAVHRNKNTNNLVKTGERILKDNNVYDPAYIQQMLMSGEFKLQQSKPDGSFEDIVWQGSSLIQEVYDTSDDAAAEAQYEAETQDLQKRDKILELRLDQVQTQQQAVHTELESVRNVIKENIEGSFGTFA